MIDIKQEQSPKDSLRNLEDMIAQEENCQFDSFSAADAMKLAEIMMENAKELGIPVAMCIYLNGCTVFQYLPEGTGKLNELWMKKKIATVSAFGWSTMRYWTWLETVDGSRRNPEILPVADVVPCGGGFPIAVKGCGVIGVIAVSGPGDQVEHDFIVDCLEKFRNA